MKFEWQKSADARRVTLELDRALDRSSALVIVIVISELFGTPLLGIPTKVVELASGVLS